MRFVSLFTFWIKNEWLREKLNHFLGFAIVGVIMTFVTILFNYVCLTICEFNLMMTYVGVYIVTVFISYLLNNFLVFKQEFSHIKLLLYYGVYFTGMLIGVGLIDFFDKAQIIDFIHPSLAPGVRNFWLSIMPIPLVLIWNFFLTSLVLKKKTLFVKKEGK